MDKTTLGNRMKENYENRSRFYLTRRTCAIIRVDGKAFHSFTKGFKRPFDAIFTYCMNETAKYLCENIQGCKLAYVQSDEMSLLLTDYDDLDTEAWFDYNLQKMCSVAASMATYAFNKAIRNFYEEIDNSSVSISVEKILRSYNIDKDYIAFDNLDIYNKEYPALFDARCFNIPKEEVNNYFLWRQRDCSKNSIQAVAQTLYSHKELEGLNCDQLQNKMFTEKGVNWNNYKTGYKRGRCVIYADTIQEAEKVQNVDKGWVVDEEIPLFNEKPEYIEKKMP